MGDHLKHLRGVEAAAAQTLKMLDDCLAVFRRVALDGGELLVETEDPIGEIAEQAGFSNNPYFYKAFKKHNGVTPAEYRRINGWQAEQEQELV